MQGQTQSRLRHNAFLIYKFRKSLVRRLEHHNLYLILRSTMRRKLGKAPLFLLV